ncbi:NADH:flavin oxidoreductase [Novosphingobium resinovorum]|uniref:NADH:flavin oxidoreductase n=1 Tax=Novosphingobium resinovorum TaxID=158500 RepID=A0A031JRD7_9SPHN|nr:NADH:flavin oxidoreductase [Novosphingobium resinovorum]EZP79338.1 NADH:flavin oxidoreductase [Novosphingobium resinovorum]
MAQPSSLDKPDPTVAPLFDTVTLGTLELKNRLVMAPMTRAFSPDGVPGANVARYYRRRAEGGVGLIISEGTWINHPAASNDPNVPVFHGEAALAGWREVCRQVHAAGAKMVPQLWHVGAAAKSDVAEIYKDGMVERTERLGPSGLVKSGVTGGRAITATEIEQVIDAYAAAARQAMEIGFDGVEIHGAHGYLIDQFFWNETNARTDLYGGDVAARTRFAVEVVHRIKASTAPDFPVILRFSQWKMQDYTARAWPTPEDLAKFLKPLVEAGVDIFHCSQRRYWEPEFPGSDLNLAGWTRKLSGRPAITVGSVTLDSEMISTLMNGQTAKPRSLADLVERVTREEFDLVAIGRALVVNPDWPKVVAGGDAAHLNPFSVSALADLN